MKNIFAVELSPHFVLVMLGMVVPLGLFLLSPDSAFLYEFLFYWLGAFLTLAGAVGLVKFTFDRLVSIGLNIRSDDLLQLPEERLLEESLLKAHAKTVELFVLGLTLISLILGDAPYDVSSLLLFICLRLGGILLLLGGTVMLVTHFRMIKL